MTTTMQARVNPAQKQRNDNYPYPLLLVFEGWFGLVWFAPPSLILSLVLFQRDGCDMIEFVAYSSMLSGS